tara:strand:- start:2159 stop:2347 length:189 start_codon:yes stop_codon:yes gene_type:complete
MKKLLLMTLSFYIFGCSDNVQMESDEEAAYNDSVATCIYKNGNPTYGSKEYERIEEMCENKL